MKYPKTFEDFSPVSREKRIDIKTKTTSEQHVKTYSKCLMMN